MNTPAAPRFRLPVARALALAALLAGARASAADLTVDQAFGNNPYTQSSDVTYGNLVVGQISQGAYTQNDGVLVNVSGTVTVGQTQSSSGTYDLGTNGASGSNAAFLQADSLVVGAGGQGMFTQHSGTVVTRTVSLQTASSSAGGAYYLGGGSLNTIQVGQNTGTATSGTFYFFGGTLTALADNARFLQGLTAAYVYDTATINSGAYNVTMGQALQTYGFGGDNGLTKRGSGTLTLTGASTYTGPTTLSAGVLNAGSTGALGNGGTISFAGGTLQYSAASAGVDFSPRFSTAANQAINLDTNGQNVLLGAGLGGSGTSLTKQGAGTLTLTGANTYTGATTVSAGTLQVGNGGTGGTLGTGDTANNAALVFNRSNALTYGGAISGSGSLTKLGAGTLTLTGNNTYAGNTALNAGTLNAGSASALGNTGTISFSGGTLQYSAANQTDYSGHFSSAANQAFSIDTNGQNVTFASGLRGGGGSLTKLGAGTLTLTGASNYSGNTLVRAGTLALTGSGSVVTNGNATFTVDGGATGQRPAFTQSGTNSSVSTGGVTVGGIGMGSVTQSAGSFTTSGAGLTLGAASSATGGYTLSGGSLSTGVVRVGASGVGTFTQSGGSFSTNANDLILANDANSVGTLNLSGAGSTLSTGTVRVGVNGVGIVNQSGGSFSTNKFLFLGRETGSRGDYTLSGTGSLSTGDVSLGYHGEGTFTQSGGSFTISAGKPLSLGYDAGVNATYSLNGGTLTASLIAAGGSGNSTFNFNGGTLRANASNASFLSGLSTANVQAGGARIDTAGFNVTVAQALGSGTASGTADGGLTKLGAGTLILTAASTYTGATVVSAGTLLANNPSGSATGSGNVDVLAGATLSGSGRVGGSLTIENGATLAPGNSPGRLTVGGSLALQSGATLRLELGGTTAGSQYDQVALGGSLSLAGASLDVQVVNGFTLAPNQTFFILDRTGSDVSLSGLFANAPGGLYTDAAGDTFLINYAATNPADGDNRLNDVSLTVVSVPEPTTWALVAGGLGSLLLLQRRRRTPGRPSRGQRPTATHG